jgi:hypothetical protein
MSAPNYHLNHTQTGSSNYERFGAAGTFYEATAVAAGTEASFDGAGGAGVIIGAAAAQATTKLHVMGGGIVLGSDLLPKTMYDISVSKVEAVGGTVYVFRRQQ